MTLRILDTEFGNSWKPMVYQVKLGIVGSVGVRFENHRANVVAMIGPGASKVFVTVPLHELDGNIAKRAWWLIRLVLMLLRSR